MIVQALAPAGIALANATPGDAEAGTAAFEMTLGAGGVADAPVGVTGGYPGDNTLGWTTDDPDLDRDFYDTEGAISVVIDMGNLNNKHRIRGADGYALTLDLSATAYYWYDGDRRFDPVTGNYDGYGDDPCPNDPFPVFDVKVNGVLVHTYMGENTFGCEPGGPEDSRSFRFIKPSEDDPLNVVRVPVGNVYPGDANVVTIRPHDYALPGYMPLHNKATDGWKVSVASVKLELVAPPLVIAHGWTTEWNPPQENPPPDAWQTDVLPGNLRGAFKEAYGQDPWAWAGEGAGTHAFSYDRKQDIRDSARELGRFVRSVKSDHGYDGKIWITAHSMGGLVSRYYLEMQHGNRDVEKLGQMGTPNLGSWMAEAYTDWNFKEYEAADEDYTATMVCIGSYDPGEKCPFIVVRTGWRDWWEHHVGAFQWQDGLGHGRDRLADFALKTETYNPFVREWTADAFPATDVDYYCVWGRTIRHSFLHPFTGGGDGPVSVESATLDGRIECNGVWADHGGIPEHMDTARHLSRFFAEREGYPGASASGMTVNGVTTSAAGAPGTEGAPGTTSGVASFTLDAETAFPVTAEFPVDAAPDAAFVVSSPRADPALEVTLTAPDGSTFTGADAARGVEYHDESVTWQHVRMFTVGSPAVGTWTVTIEPALGESFEAPLPVTVRALVNGSIALAAWTAAGHVAPGEDVTLNARDTNATGAAVTDATVTAAFTTATGDEVALTLADADGDGTFTVTFPAPDARGALDVLVTAEGAAWTRVKPVDVIVATFPDLVVRDVTASPVDAWGGDVITLAVTVENAGDGATSAAVPVTFTGGEPADGAPVLATAIVPAGLAPGASVVVSASAIAPNAAVTLVAEAARDLVETSYLNNVARSAAPFVPHPRTAAFLDGPAGANGWFHGDVRVTLAPFDGSTPTTAGTYYRVGDGPVKAYDAPFTLTADGAHDLAFWSVTTDGRTEPARDAFVGIDRDAPAGALTRPVEGHVNVADQSAPNPFGFTVLTGVVVLEAEAADAVSGVTRVTFLVDGVPLADAHARDGATWALEWDTAQVPVGNHRLAFEVEDAAGHVTRSADVPVYVVSPRSGSMNPAAEFVGRVRPPL